MENNLSTQEEKRTVDKFIEVLSATETKRPEGIVDWMHFGLAMRYGGIKDVVEGQEEWRQLEKRADGLTKETLNKILPLLERRAWAVGTLLMCRLPGLLSPQLFAVARGRYLGGLSRHIQRAEKPNSMDVAIGGFDVAAEVLRKLPDASLDAEAVAEIGANAIKANRLDVLDAVLSHHDFSGDGYVARINGYPDQVGFEKQLSQHSTRMLDVLLEAAVRCRCPSAMRVLLERGACPNIPCWRLERNSNKWFSALSFAIDAFGEANDDPDIEEMIGLLLKHGANAQGLACEGLNNPIMLAMRNQRLALADRLREHGACLPG
jgi:hypothetical protein